MRWKTTLLIFLSVLLACCNPMPVDRSVRPAIAVSENCITGDYLEELISAGQVREFQLHIPAAYKADTPAALVLGFHGAGSNALQFESYSGFSYLADREGFIVVYPQALGEHHTWNTTMGSTNPDLQFVRDLIDVLSARCSIDQNRVYASGHSNGGGMANRLACDLSDRIAAIGSVSGAYQWAEDCSPSQPVAVLSVHGTDDPIIPYNGFEGTDAPPAAYYLIGVPIPQWASSWAHRNDCQEKSSRVVQSDQVIEDKWSNCSAGVEVFLYTVRGGGHGWTQAFDAAQVIWDFFARHPLSDT
jgi:polyhydroxybutyrate depolymerase